MLRAQPQPKTPRPRPGRRSSQPEAKRTKRVTIPLSAQEKALINRSAQKRGLPVSSMLRALIFDSEEGLGRVHPEVTPTRRQEADRKVERERKKKE